MTPKRGKDLTDVDPQKRDLILRFRTITTILHSLGTTLPATQATNDNQFATDLEFSQDKDLRLLTGAATLFVKDHDVVAVAIKSPGLHQDLHILASYESPTNFPRQLVAISNPLSKPPQHEFTPKSAESMDGAITGSGIAILSPPKSSINILDPITFIMKSSYVRSLAHTLNLRLKYIFRVLTVKSSHYMNTLRLLSASSTSI
jgi:hypothetical protein